MSRIAAPGAGHAGDPTDGAARRRAAGLVLFAALALPACGGSNHAGGLGGSSGGAGVVGADGGGAGGTPTDGATPFPDGMAPDVGFSGPDATGPYMPRPGTCGLDAPAFCETFEAGPATRGSRSGELDPSRWSVARGQPYSSANFDDAIRVGPALIGTCRADLSNVRVLPDSDVLVCDPTSTIPTRHALATAAE